MSTKNFDIENELETLKQEVMDQDGDLSYPLSPCCNCDYVLEECPECSGSGEVDLLFDGNYTKCENCEGSGFMDGFGVCDKCGDTFRI